MRILLFGIRFLLIVLITFLSVEVFAQEADIDSASKITIPGKQLPFKRGDFRARIADDYVKKFSSMSDELKIKEDELASIRYRAEAVKERSKKVQQKEQKALFKDNLKGLKISENQLAAEVGLIKKALRLLQENKTGTDPDKMRVLNEIEEIESKILGLKTESETEKTDMIHNQIEYNTRDVSINPPNESCEVVYNGVDRSTDKQRKEMAKDFLFGYTHPKLKSFFKDDHFLVCEVKLIELDKKKYLWLYITISSKDAVKNYGSIPRLSPMKFELLDGEILYTASAQNAIGTLEPYSGDTKYEVILPLDKSKYKQLAKSEIDKIGIMWSSGYEQYEVYNVDVVVRQIECLEKL